MLLPDPAHAGPAVIRDLVRVLNLVGSGRITRSFLGLLGLLGLRGLFWLLRRLRRLVCRRLGRLILLLGRTNARRETNSGDARSEQDDEDIRNHSAIPRTP